MVNIWYSTCLIWSTSGIGSGSFAVHYLHQWHTDTLSNRSLVLYADDGMLYHALVLLADYDVLQEDINKLCVWTMPIFYITTPPNVNVWLYWEMDNHALLPTTSLTISNLLTKKIRLLWVSWHLDHLLFKLGTAHNNNMQKSQTMYWNFVQKVLCALKHSNTQTTLSVLCPSTSWICSPSLGPTPTGSYWLPGKSTKICFETMHQILRTLLWWPP